MYSNRTAFNFSRLSYPPFGIFSPAFSLLQNDSTHALSLLCGITHNKDKAPVENFVKITYRRIYAFLRNETFHSLALLNKAVKEKLESHHQVDFQKKTFSRQELFTEQEKPLLQPLPESPYQVRHYTKAKVQKNYHVVIGEDWHFYSVPFRYIGKEVRIAYCEDTVEIYSDNQRIALHSRNYKSHGHTTIAEHMPDSHKEISRQQGWDPEYYLRKAAENGPCTYELFKKVMDSKMIIDQSYSSCLGLLRLIKAYGALRMENACKRALTGYKFSYTAVKNILDNNMDMVGDANNKEYRIPEHANLRGASAYEE